MQWACKFCNFTTDKRGNLHKHYRLKHGGLTRTSPLPCLHKDCVCTFKSFNALKVHLSKVHCQKSSTGYGEMAVFSCQICDFREPCVEQDFFTHLHTHLRVQQKVQCPYQDCDFETSVFSTFRAHRSRNHHSKLIKPFKPDILSRTEII